MSANRQQGGYLTIFLASFTGLVAGLVLWVGNHAAIGVILTLVSIVLMAYSLVGFRKIKPLEFLD